MFGILYDFLKIYKNKMIKIGLMTLSSTTKENVKNKRLDKIKNKKKKKLKILIWK